MNEALSKLKAIRDQHQIMGKKLFILSDEKIYPCHALYLSVLNRSIELYDGFLLLAHNRNYGCCMALLRMQLDNVLRFYGVLITVDQHKTAMSIINGMHLNKIKDKDGKYLQDIYLVNLLSKKKPWVKKVYKLCSGYIHFSDQHIFHLIEKTDSENDGTKTFTIGSQSEDIDETHWKELVNTFENTTQGIFKLFPKWEELSKKYTSIELDKEYTLYTQDQI